MDRVPAPRSRAHRAAGQAATEFALLLPIFVLISMGIFDLGRAFHTSIAASNAARVGLIYAQQVQAPAYANTGCPAIDPNYSFVTVSEIISATKCEAQGGIDPSHMTVTVCFQHKPLACPDTTGTDTVSSRDAITVTVTVPFSTITPFVHLAAISGSATGHTFTF